jgi:hypothetical protein
MTTPNIWYFIKFFTEETHADQFVAGDLYMNTLSHFKKLESVSDDGRPDVTEGIANWWQPHDILMKFSAPGIGETEITSRDLAAPVSMSFTYHEYVHIFCLYTVHTIGFKFINGKIDCTTSEADELRRQLRIDERCLRFGKYAVIIRPADFVARVQQVLKGHGRKFAHGLVQYYDESTFHGTIPRNEIPFKKQKRFSYQQEFRICVYPKIMHNAPITLNIGNISNMCGKMLSSQLNSQLAFKTEPATA